jgi:hypothetical protein
MEPELERPAIPSPYGTQALPDASIAMENRYDGAKGPKPVDGERRVPVLENSTTVPLGCCALIRNL